VAVLMIEVTTSVYVEKNSSISTLNPYPKAKQVQSDTEVRTQLLQWVIKMALENLTIDNNRDD
jgi:hypothetical protein